MFELDLLFEYNVVNENTGAFMFGQQELSNRPMASGKERAWKAPETSTVSRLQRVFRKLGLDEAQPALHQASETELQAVFARYLRKVERHAHLGIAPEDFSPLTLPTVAISEVENSVHRPDRPMAVVENRSPLLKPYFDALTVAELVSVMTNDMNIALDEPPLDEDDFLGCRFFFRFVAEAVEHGSCVIDMQDEKQTVAVMVHIKAIRRIEGTALFQVEYNCVPKNDRNLMETMRILRELAKDAQPCSLVGTEHQIHFTNQILQAHERLLNRTVVSKHDEEWYPRQKSIRPSFIVPLSPMTSDSEFSTLLELKADATPASERATCSSSDDAQCEQPGPGALHSCVVCDKKSNNICSRCKLVKYCSRDCQVSDWPSHKKRCKAPESQKQSQPLPSGASILVDPKGHDMGDNIMLLIDHHDPISSIANVKPAKLNQMPDHEEGEVYVVKVQSSRGDFMICDRKRSFTIMTSDPGEQAALRSVIESVKHRGGAKAYLYARNEGDRFRVYLEELPEQYVNW